MKRTLTIILLFAAQALMAQIPEHLTGKVSYPVFDQEPWIGVIDVESTAMKYDASVDYKVMIDVYDKVNNKSNAFTPLNEAARTYNLLSSLGVPEEKVSMALIIHGGAVDAFLSNEAYNEKFREDNPNLTLIRAMQEKGVKFYVCSQTMGFRNLPAEDLCDVAEVTLSAKTTMIILDQQGYSYLNVNED